MSGSHGTGYPIAFRCPQARRENTYWDRHWDTRRARTHKVRLTGRTKPTPRNGKGHPRKSWTTRDLERMAPDGERNAS